MKQIFLIVTLLLGTFVYSNAQTKSKADSAKAAANKAAGLNKDGTPDMRLKANKDAAKAKQAAPAATPAPAAQTPVAAAPKVTTQAPAAAAPRAATQTQAKPAAATSTTDKVFGTDAKGRTIYEGPRGGHYIINSKGNKEYVKKT